MTTMPHACTKCKTRIAFTEDWILWPWPDGAWLCTPCNETRHETDDYTEVEQAQTTGAETMAKTMAETVALGVTLAEALTPSVPADTVADTTTPAPDVPSFDGGDSGGGGGGSTW